MRVHYGFAAIQELQRVALSQYGKPGKKEDQCPFHSVKTIQSKPLPLVTAQNLCCQRLATEP
jgi:hypothetical protein